MANKKKKDRKRYTARSARDSQRRTLAVRRALISLLIIAAVSATLVFLVLRNHQQISLAENGIGSLLTPVQNALNTATNSVKDFFTTWRNYDKLQDEYDALNRENQQLSLQLSSAEEALMENDRLKGLLEAKSSYESLEPIYARVIARDAGQWFSTFSINRGDMHGVSAGMAVVNGDGLVGRVYEVGMNYANVITIIDPRSSLACLVQRTRDNGIMEGGVADNADTAECYIYYLPNVNNIVPGDEIVTSGTDGYYPKGLNVGTVTQVSLDAGSEGNFAVVEPHVDFLHIEEVIVLRDVVEKADQLSALPTATPSPTATPAPTTGASAVQPVAPETTEEIFTFPQAGDTDNKNNSANTSTAIEPLPEDAWVEN
jgi:rod shape-determining protein MreC